MMASLSTTSSLATPIDVHDVSKRYGKVTALDGVSMAVQPGTIVGLLGPNGAGKTTLLEIMCGLRAPGPSLATPPGQRWRSMSPPA